MNYFTINTYEMKREIVNFSKKVSNGCTKPESGFIMDMLYGMFASKDVKITSIARSLNEDIKLDNTVERLCNRLSDFKGRSIVEDNYRKSLANLISDEPIVLFDNSDITKIYGKKFEDLDVVVDASDPKKEKKPGYPVCNVTMLSKKQKQPVPIYSKIVSTKSKNFKSMNKYTLESIKEAYKAIGKKFTGVLDRGYDDKKVFRYLDKLGVDFVIRLKTTRNFLYHGKSTNVEKIAKSKKGRISMKLTFSDGEKNVKISCTKVNMTDGNHEEYTLVTVYGIGEDPMILLTNKELKDKRDIRYVVRLYMYRWRIEEYHKAIKGEYHYEDMRVRTLEEMNNLNFLLMMLVGLECILIDEIDTKSLSMKIQSESKSLRNNVIVLISQFAKGIQAILSYAHEGIKRWKGKTKKKKNYQMQLSLEL